MCAGRDTVCFFFLLLVQIGHFFVLISNAKQIKEIEMNQKVDLSSTVLLEFFSLRTTYQCLFGRMSVYVRTQVLDLIYTHLVVIFFLLFVHISRHREEATTITVRKKK